MKKRLALTAFLITSIALFSFVSYADFHLNDPAAREEPDFTVRIIDAPEEVQVGEGFRIVTHIEAVGGNGALSGTNADQSSFRVELRLVDSEGHSAGYAISDLNIGGLPGGSGLDWVFFWDSVPQITPGRYTLEVVLYDDGEIEETTENNNAHSVELYILSTPIDLVAAREASSFEAETDESPSETGTPTGTSDLVVEFVDPPQKFILPEDGMPHYVTVRVTNRGAATSENVREGKENLFSVELMHESNAGYGPVRSGYVWIDGLDAGESTEKTFRFDLVRNSASGGYKFSAYVDRNDNIDEGNNDCGEDYSVDECNNHASVPFIVITGPVPEDPDLIVEFVRPPSSFTLPDNGDSFEITVGVINQGGDISDSVLIDGKSAVRLFFWGQPSGSTIREAFNTLIFTFDADELQNNAYYLERSFDFDLSSLERGNYQFGAYVNYYYDDKHTGHTGPVVESDSDNNGAYADFTVEFSSVCSSRDDVCSVNQPCCPGNECSPVEDCDGQGSCSTSHLCQQCNREGYTCGDSGNCCGNLKCVEFYDRVSPECYEATDYHVCDRTIQVRRAILGQLPELNYYCTQVTLDNLRGIQNLHLFSKDIGSLKKDDFQYLSNLDALDLNNNRRLNSLDSDVFDHLSGLLTLSLADNNMDALPEGIFRNLIDIRTIFLRGNNFDCIPRNAFGSTVPSNVDVYFDAIGSPQSINDALCEGTGGTENLPDLVVEFVDPPEGFVLPGDAGRHDVVVRVSNRGGDTSEGVRVGKLNQFSVELIYETDWGYGPVRSGYVWIDGLDAGESREETFRFDLARNSGGGEYTFRAYVDRNDNIDEGGGDCVGDYRVVGCNNHVLVSLPVVAGDVVDDVVEDPDLVVEFVDPPEGFVLPGDAGRHDVVVRVSNRGGDTSEGVRVGKLNQFSVELIYETDWGYGPVRSGYVWIDGLDAGESTEKTFRFDLARNSGGGEYTFRAYVDRNDNIDEGGGDCVGDYRVVGCNNHVLVSLPVVAGDVVDDVVEDPDLVVEFVDPPEGFVLPGDAGRHDVVVRVSNRGGDTSEGVRVGKLNQFSVELIYETDWGYGPVRSGYVWIDGLDAGESREETFRFDLARNSGGGEYTFRAYVDRNDNIDEGGGDCVGDYRVVGCNNHVLVSLPVVAGDVVDDVVEDPDLVVEFVDPPEGFVLPGDAGRHDVVVRVSNRGGDTSEGVRVGKLNQFSVELIYETDWGYGPVRSGYVWIDGLDAGESREETFRFDLARNSGGGEYTFRAYVDRNDNIDEGGGDCVGDYRVVGCNNHVLVSLPVVAGDVVDDVVEDPDLVVEFVDPPEGFVLPGDAGRHDVVVRVSNRGGDTSEGVRVGKLNQFSVELIYETDWGYGPVRSGYVWIDGLDAGESREETFRFDLARNSGGGEYTFRAYVDRNDNIDEGGGDCVGDYRVVGCNNHVLVSLPVVAGDVVDDVVEDPDLVVEFVDPPEGFVLPGDAGRHDVVVRVSNRGGDTSEGVRVGKLNQFSVELIYETDWGYGPVRSGYVWIDGLDAGESREETFRFDLARNSGGGEYTFRAYVDRNDNIDEGGGDCVGDYRVVGCNNHVLVSLPVVNEN